MASTTEDILNAIGNYIASILQKVGDYLSDLFKPIISKIGDYIGNVFDALMPLINRIKGVIERLYDEISRRISDLIDGALSFIQDIYNRVVESMTSLFDAAASYLEGIYNSVVDSVAGVLNDVIGYFVDIYDKVVAQLEYIAETVVNWVTDLFENIKLKIGEIVDSAARVVNAIIDAVVRFVNEVVDTIGLSLRTLLEVASDIPDALSNLGQDFYDAIQQYVGQPLDAMPVGFWNTISEIVLSSANKTGIPGVGNNPTLLGTMGDKPRSREEWDRFFRDILPKDSFTSSLFNGVVALFFTMQVFSGIAQAQAQIVLQEYGEEFPYNIPQVPDVIKLKHFGIIDDREAIPLIKKQGFSTEDSQRLIQISEATPPEGESLSWWLRGFYTDDDINESLNKRGWNIKDREVLKQAAYFIPPVQDIITMAVREVFTPEVAQRFGQYDDYPPEFTEHAMKLGVSEEWAKRYWAAHWSLPSPQMGFEMLHRRVIDMDTMKLLLRSADVMPFWQQKIIDISYAPYTRVDIRRMHKVGVLSEEEVLEAYQDLGYDADKSRRLTDFTLELNRDKSSDDVDELAKITLSNILGFYTDGLLNRAEAYSMLIGIGLSDEGANLYLTSVDLDEQRQERKNETSLILDKAKAGVITFEQAQNELARLGLETRELAKAITQLVRITAQRTKIPAKGDLDKMYLSSIIDRNEYVDTLKLLGYSDNWASKLLLLLEGKENVG